jgi:hypothetical protein
MIQELGSNGILQTQHEGCRPAMISNTVQHVRHRAAGFTCIVIVSSRRNLPCPVRRAIQLQGN